MCLDMRACMCEKANGEKGGVGIKRNLYGVYIYSFYKVFEFSCPRRICTNRFSD